MANVPVAPPVPFPAPHIHPAERNFRITLEDGSIVGAYLRRRISEDKDKSKSLFAYRRYANKVQIKDLGDKGKVFYALLYERQLESGRYREKEIVVIKKLSKAWIQRPGSRAENPLSEMAVAQNNVDVDVEDHIVPMIEALESEKYYYMVTPFLGHDLRHAMNQNLQPFHDQILKALAETLVYLKGRHIIHRDFSPENVIFCRNDQNRIRCPLIDFAMALQCASTLEGSPCRIVPQAMPCGKWPYMSPEVHLNGALDFGVDLWALGCTLFAMWTGKRLYHLPFDRSWRIFITHNVIADAHQYNCAAFENTPDLPTDFIEAIGKLRDVQELSDAQRDLLSRMLTVEPTARITAEEILQHEYIQPNA
jgi:serine/threonine protein kinase